MIVSALLFSFGWVLCDTIRRWIVTDEKDPVITLLKSIPDTLSTVLAVITFAVMMSYRS